MESDKKDIVFDLRDSGTVTITIERFEQLIACEARFSILQQIRVRDVREKSYISCSQEDYLLGQPALDAWDLRAAQKPVQKDE